MNRILCALRHTKADRVPNFEITISKGFISFMLGTATNDTLTSIIPEKAVQIAMAIGQDAIPCYLAWRPANFRFTSSDEFSGTRLPDVEPMHGKLSRCINAINAVKGCGLGICAQISGIFTQTYMSVGPIPIQSFMYQLYDDPAFVNSLLDFYMQYDLNLINKVKDLPFHFFYIGDDLSSTTGLLVSPELLEEIWVPRMQRIITAMLETGKPVIFHCCGNEDFILPHLIKWGVNAIHPIQPGANDIYNVHRKYGRNLTLIGNIDVAGVLSYGTPEEVAADVRSHIDRLADNGGYIACSSHSIIDSVPPSNFIAMLYAVRKYGAYANL